MRAFAAAPRWRPDQLEARRVEAIALFREQRVHEPLERYLEALDDKQGTVEEFLETTVDLTRLGAAAIEVLADDALREVLRYLAGPPVSEADLKVLAETDSFARGRLEEDPGAARRAVETVLCGLDRRRFAWVGEGREPEEAERAAATLATAAMIASRRVLTDRANDAKLQQEAAVADALTREGFTRVPTAGPIRTVEAAPGPGRFCSETVLGERKADLVVGLWDRRRMAIECKVSNSETNSIKRVQNDAAVKAETWLQDLGRTQIVPVAVLSGVFRRSTLENAQTRGLTLFWAHRLEEMTDWIRRTG